MVKCANPNCNNIFDPSEVSLGKKKRKFCSTYCLNITHVNKYQKQHNLNPNDSRVCDKCVICGENIKRNTDVKVYCSSKECKRKFMAMTTQPRIICLQCGKPIYLPVRRSRQKQYRDTLFCSDLCKQLFKRSKKSIEQVHKKVANDLMVKHCDIVFDYIDKITNS
jgi:hypothetical protein